MDFKDETKQAEFDAISAYYALIAKRPSNTANKSLLNQLRDIIVRQFGNGAWQELHRATRNEAAETRREVQLVGKSTGGGLSSNRQRRPSPGTPKEARPGTARAQRIAARQAKEQGGRSVAEVVAVDKCEVIVGDAKNYYNNAGISTENLFAPPEIQQKDLFKDAVELKQVELSTGQEFETPYGKSKIVVSPTGGKEVAHIVNVGYDNDQIKQEASLLADAASLTAKDLVEKYGRDLIFEYLLNAGFERDNLEQKTDRQIANILKKHVSE